MGHDLRDKTVTGVMWNTLARIGQQVMQFALSVILARLLLPDDFGTIGMVLVFTTFLGMFAEAGFGAVLVQRSSLSDLHVQSVFWFNVASGLLLTGAMFVSAPLLAAFYHEPALLSVARGLSPVFLLSTAGLVPTALMQRRMQFKLLARISLIAVFLSGMIGILLAVLGAGVSSLVAQSLSSYLVITVFSWQLSGHRLRLKFSLRALRELWGFTGNLLGFNFVNYWARSADNLLAGRYLGPEALGYYSRAYSLMLMPITQIISVISNVMFAALSSIKTDQSRVKSIYLRAIGMIALIAFPLMVGLLVVSDSFVLTLFGDRWAGMIPTLRILALVGLLQAVVNPTGWLYLSQGRTDVLFRWGLVNSVLVVMAIAAGVALGSIETLALCYAMANLLLLYPNIVIPGRLVGIGFSDVVLTVAGPLLGSAIMGLFVYGLGLVLADALADLPKLILQVALGGFIYGAFAVGARLPAWRELVTLLREQLGKSRLANVLPTLQ